MGHIIVEDSKLHQFRINIYNFKLYKVYFNVPKFTFSKGDSTGLFHILSIKD